VFNLLIPQNPDFSEKATLTSATKGDNFIEAGSRNHSFQARMIHVLEE
jgi:hypothetical protein